jgi:hypothetical protein
MTLYMKAVEKILINNFRSKSKTVESMIVYLEVAKAENILSGVLDVYTSLD